MGFELMTSSLPRMRSTPELHRLCGAENEVRTRDPQLGRLMLYQLSYFRITNSSGRRGIRTPEGIASRFTVCPSWPLWYPPDMFSRFFQDQNFEPIEGFEPTTPRLQITCSGQLSYIGVQGFFRSFSERDCKYRDYFSFSKQFSRFLKSVIMENVCLDAHVPLVEPLLPIGWPEHSLSENKS